MHKVQPPPFSKTDDIESGNYQSYTMMQESPELRWAFIRKVYTILTLQLLLTVAVAAMVVSTPSIALFIRTTKAGLGLYILIFILTLIVSLALKRYHKKHPLNLLILGLFTVCVAFVIGLGCSFKRGEIILEAAILTSVVAIGLTLYTFWAAKRGCDFSFLGPFLCVSALVLLVFAIIQILFPLGKLSLMMFGCLGAMIFSGFIIYDTDNLIKRFTYDEYIWASVNLYMDVVNLFQYLLLILDSQG